MVLVDDQVNLAARLVRSGEKTQAQFILTQVVEWQPDHAYAWLWLSELATGLEEQMAMLEQALKYLPDGPDGCKDLTGALNEIHRANSLPSHSSASAEAKTPTTGEMKKVSEDEIFHRAERLAILGKQMEALELVKALIEAGSDQERTWLLYSELSPGLAEKISALEKVAAINPNNATAISRLEKFRETADQPLSAARYLEDCGDTDQALALYQSIAAQSESPTERYLARECITRLSTGPDTGDGEAASPSSVGFRSMFHQISSFTHSRVLRDR